LSPDPAPKRRGLSFSLRSSKRHDSVSSDSEAPTSEVAAAAAAASSTSATPEQQSDFKMPTAPTPTTSPQRRSSLSRSRTSAGSELRDAKRTLQENERQLRKVSLRSHEMSDNASNFAAAAQGFLELSHQKK